MAYEMTLPASDDTTHPAWPPDLNNDTTVNIIDALMFGPVIMLRSGDPGYDGRFDLSPNGTINIIDVLVLGPVIMQSCTNP